MNNGTLLVQRYLTTSINRLHLSQEHLIKEIERIKGIKNSKEANVTIPSLGTRDSDLQEIVNPRLLQHLLEEIPGKVETLAFLVAELDDLLSPTDQ